MFEDQIIDEVRNVRDQIAAQFDYDVKAIGAYYQAQQKEQRVTVVSRQPRQPELDDIYVLPSKKYQIADAAAA